MGKFEYIKLNPDKELTRMIVEGALGTTTEEDRSHDKRKDLLIEWGTDVKEIHQLFKKNEQKFLKVDVGTEITKFLEKEKEVKSWIEGVGKIDSSLKTILEGRIQFLKDYLNWSKFEREVPLRARDGHSACADKAGNLWIFGGHAKEGALNDVWRFSLGI